MGLFRRKAKGRHALGAAVTAIPSGPLRPLSVPAAVPAVGPAAPLPAQLPAPAVAPPVGEPSVLESIAQMIVTGEAWATDLEDVDALHRAAVDAPAAVVVVGQVEPPVGTPAPSVESAAPVPAAPPAPPVAPGDAFPPPDSAPAARASLEAALAELLPHQSSVVMNGPPVQAAAAPRVQLGFRDGTSTTLEPGSDQSRALEELAQSLTRRD